MSPTLVHQIWHGDSRELSKRFHAKRKIRSLITDPPFGVDNQSNMAKTPEGKKHAHKIAGDETPEQAMQLFTEVWAATHPGMMDDSDIYVFTSHQVLKEWLVFTDELFAPQGFKRKAILVWEKDGPGMGDVEGTAWGMGMEFILYFKRGNRPKGATRRNAVLHVPQMRPGTLVHPHEKPEQLLEMFIKESTDPGDFVYDPFGGSGSLARAARRCGRSGVSVEIGDIEFEKAIRKFNEGDQAMDFG